MKFTLPLFILIVTLALLVVGLHQTSAVSTGHRGPTAGAALPGLSSNAQDPEQALSYLLSAVRIRDWHGAHEQLANSDQIDEKLVTREWQGDLGSLRSFSGLEGWELHPLRKSGDEAQMRVTLHWSTAVGSIDEVRDLTVRHTGNEWRVVWPPPKFPSVPAQVIPVNYLRWDLVSSSEARQWGQNNVDAPRIRILSMNAVPYKGGSVVMGEVVNEDTIPAFVNVNATLLDAQGNAIDEESSFDRILHVLLPKQVTPYRIDFPSVAMEKIKSVRMSSQATLVPASADPVIGVMDQKIQNDALGHTILQGNLLNQNGEVVNIPHVIASFYDDSGKVIWVADAYVDRALLPLTPQPFVVPVPESIAGKVHSYHVVANQYSMGAS